MSDQFVKKSGGQFKGKIYDYNGDEILGGASGVTDHGALTGLGDDDHSQYHTDARAATWLAANHETTYDHTSFINRAKALTIASLRA